MSNATTEYCTAPPAITTDFYKTGHIAQYPAGTELVYSNLTARGAKHALVSPLFDKKVVFFGLQAVVLKYLMGKWNRDFFAQPREFVVGQYQRRMDTALGPGSVSADHIGALHDLGHLPLRIKALPEGSRVNLRVALLTIVNTDPRFFWLTNYLETALSTELHKSITTATTAHEFRRVVNHFAEKTGAPMEFTAWQCHDFSMRGMSGIEDAAACGAAHLLSSYGTDTIPAIDFLEAYYGADADKELIGGSVPATEHSVMCMGGEGGELDTFRRLVTEIYPGGIVSIVSDSWDFWRVMTEYALVLKDEILARTPNALGMAKVVFRPDSGDPVKIICGDPDATPGTPEWLGAVRCLAGVFGTTATPKGFLTLHERVGLIYGDSITLERQWAILQRLAEMGYSSANIVFGVGSFTYQTVSRDNYGMAVKATFGVVNGEYREISKNPKTDTDHLKKSACGLVRVEKEGADFVLYDRQTWAQEAGGALETVFEDGRLVRKQTLGEIRALLAGG